MTQPHVTTAQPRPADAAGASDAADASQLVAALQAARREQEDFLRAVSHDLRAPLRHITAYGQLVRELVAESNADVAALQYLDTMDRSAKQLGRMIDGLIRLGRIGLDGVQLQPVDVGAVVADVVAALTPRVAGRELQWVLPPPGAMPLVQGDLALLRELFQQLLDNAVKFTARQPQAYIELQVHCEDDAVHFSLRDNGAGFNPTHAAQLFGVFQRLHSASEFEGLGLGLAVAHRIVRHLGGQIALQGVPGGGCVVSLSLPAAGTGQL